MNPKQLLAGAFLALLLAANAPAIGSCPAKAVKITAPANSSSKPWTPNIPLNASAPAGIYKVRWLLKSLTYGFDEKLLGELRRPAPFNFVFDTTPYPYGGTMVLTADAFDAGGNLCSRDTAAINLQSQFKLSLAKTAGTYALGVVHLNASITSGVTGSRKFTATFTASDPESQIITLCTSALSSPPSFTCDWTATKPGLYKIFAQLNDAQGLPVETNWVNAAVHIK